VRTSSYRLFLLPLALIVLAAGALFSACDDDGDATVDPPPASPSPQDPSPSPEPEDPTPGPSDPTPTPPPGGGSIGVPEFDDLADLFIDGDVPGVLDRIRYTELACETVQGSGGPPPCIAGEAEGTVVSVMPFSSCEGEYMREQQVTGLLEAQAERNPQLYAAFSLKDPGTPERPLGEYGILFEVEGPSGIGPLAMMFGVSAEGEVIAMWAGCGATPAEAFERHAGSEILLEPAA
jgi:hypothetical protein